MTKDMILKGYKKLAKTRHPKISELEAAGITRNAVRYHFGSMQALRDLVPIEPQPEVDPPFKTVRQKQVCERYLEIVRELRHSPTVPQCADRGLTNRAIQHSFGSITRLDEFSREHFPGEFGDVAVELVTAEVLPKSRRYVITSAVLGCKINEPFYKSLVEYCKIADATLLIVPCADPAARVSPNGSGYLDGALKTDFVVGGDTYINDRFMISGIQPSAKQIDPTTGLARIATRNEVSMVFASPKQRLVTPAARRALMTTGAVTDANYHTKSHRSLRTAYLANQDHVIGALIVDVVDNKTFHFRQVQADEFGGFCDLGVYYHFRKRARNVRPAALVLGDWHCGVTARHNRLFVEAVAADMPPKAVVLHDMFNGDSCNPHDKKNLLRRPPMPIADELNENARDLEWFQELFDQVVVVKSNHDEWIPRHLHSGDWMREPANIDQCLVLAADLKAGRDPYAEAMRHRVDCRNVRFLRRDESFEVAGVELGHHGDKGLNGSRGSVRQYDQVIGACVVGHTHTPEIFRQVYRVGVSAELKQDWLSGPSTWSWTHCLVYENGGRQLINVLPDGSWRL